MCIKKRSLGLAVLCALAPGVLRGPVVAVANASEGAKANESSDYSEDPPRGPRGSAAGINLEKQVAASRASSKDVSPGEMSADILKVKYSLWRVNMKLEDERKVDCSHEPVGIYPGTVCCKKEREIWTRWFNTKTLEDYALRPRAFMLEWFLLAFRLSKCMASAYLRHGGEWTDKLKGFSPTGSKTTELHTALKNFGEYNIDIVPLEVPVEQQDDNTKQEGVQFAGRHLKRTRLDQEPETRITKKGICCLRQLSMAIHLDGKERILHCQGGDMVRGFASPDIETGGRMNKGSKSFGAKTKAVQGSYGTGGGLFVKRGPLESLLTSGKFVSGPLLMGDDHTNVHDKPLSTKLKDARVINFTGLDVKEEKKRANETAQRQPYTSTAEAQERWAIAKEKGQLSATQANELRADLGKGKLPVAKAKAAEAESKSAGKRMDGPSKTRGPKASGLMKSINKHLPGSLAEADMQEQDGDDGDGLLFDDEGDDDTPPPMATQVSWNTFLKEAGDDAEPCQSPPLLHYYSMVKLGLRSGDNVKARGNNIIPLPHRSLLHQEDTPLTFVDIEHWVPLIEIKWTCDQELPDAEEADWSKCRYPEMFAAHNGLSTINFRGFGRCPRTRSMVEKDGWVAAEHSSTASFEEYCQIDEFNWDEWFARSFVALIVMMAVIYIYRVGQNLEAKSTADEEE